MRRWLSCRQLPTRLKLQLWSTCVWPTLTYALFTVGFHASDVHLLQSLVYTQIRVILKDHSYRTRTSHQEVFEHHHLQTPLRMLQRLGQHLQRSAHQRLQLVDSTDCIHRLDWTHLDTMLQTIHHETHTGPAIPVDVADAPIRTKRLWKCEHCMFQTDSATNLKRHCTNIHGITQPRQLTLYHQDPQLHLPKCHHCNATFTNWRNLKLHLDQRTCTGRLATDLLPSRRRLASPIMHFQGTEWGTRLTSMIASAQWTQIAEDPEIMQELRQTCALCNKWVGRTQELSMHLNRHHSDLVDHMHQVSQQLLKLAPITMCILWTNLENVPHMPMRNAVGHHCALPPP